MLSLKGHFHSLQADFREERLLAVATANSNRECDTALASPGARPVCLTFRPCFLLRCSIKTMPLCLLAGGYIVNLSALHESITYQGIHRMARGITVLLSVLVERFPYGIQVLTGTALQSFRVEKRKRDRCWGSYIHRWRSGGLPRWSPVSRRCSKS